MHAGFDKVCPFLHGLSCLLLTSVKPGLGIADRQGQLTEPVAKLKSDYRCAQLQRLHWRRGWLVLKTPQDSPLCPDDGHVSRVFALLRVYPLMTVLKGQRKAEENDFTPT